MTDSCLRRRCLIALGLALGLVSGACSDGEGPSVDAGTPDAGPEPIEVVTQEVGPEGAIVQGERFSLDVPAGALTEVVEIEVTEGVEATLPALLARRSAVFRLEPEGLVFADPITFRVTLAEPSEAARMYWEDETGGFAPVPTTIDGAMVAGTSMHFSRAFPAMTCGGSACNGAVLETQANVSVVPDGAVFRCQYDLDSLDCAALPNAAAGGTCASGDSDPRCVFSCAAGYGDCDGQASTGCEAALLTDEAHCGDCSTACGSGQTCVSGVCEGGGSVCEPNPCEDLPDGCSDAHTRFEHSGVCTPDSGAPGGYVCEGTAVPCPTGEVCSEGVCGPAATCTEDGHADDATNAATLAPDTPVLGTVCGAFDPDADFFAITVPEVAGGCRLRVRLGLLGDTGWPRQLAPSALSLLRMTLEDLAGTELAFAAANQVGAGMFTTVTNAGDYVIALRVNAGSSTEVYDYRLDYDLTCPPPEICALDRYEPNSRVSDAYDFGEVMPEWIEAEMCGGDPDTDFFSFVVPDSCALFATEWAPSGAGLGLQDLSQSQSAVPKLFSVGTHGTYSVAWAVVGGRTYHLGLSARNSSFEYQVHLSSICPAASCGTPDPGEPNDTPAQATPIAEDLQLNARRVFEGAACGQDVDVYGPLPAGDYVNASLAFDASVCTPRLTVVDAQGNELSVGTSQSYSPQVLGVSHGSPEGTFLRIEGNESCNGAYFLVVEVGYFS